MMKLVMADDEQIFRNYMKTIIEWDLFGIEVVGICKNAAEVVACMEKEQVDIALLDINMPGKNGIDLAKVLVERFPKMKIVFITGYSEFEYAREAVRLGAYDYLLKPFTKEEIQKIIVNLIEEINQMNTVSISEEVHRQQKINEQFQNLISGQYEDAALFRELLELGIDMKEYYYTVAIFEIIQKEYTHKINRNILFEWAEALLEKEEIYCRFLGSDKPVLVFYYLPQNGNNVHVFLENFQQQLEEEQDIKSVLSVSEHADSYKKITNLYEQASYLHQMFTFAKESKISYYQNRASNRNHEIVMKIEEYIHENYWDMELTVTSLSEEIYLDQSYMRRVFLKQKGMKINEYINEVRMMKALQIMKAHDYPMAKVSELSGFSDQAYFSKCFRKYYGMTPSNYMKAYDL